MRFRTSHYDLTKFEAMDRAELLQQEFLSRFA